MQMLAIFTFVLFTLLVAIVAWWKTRREDLSHSTGYFLAGRGLGMWTIAGSLMMTNISTEQMVGLNGSAYLHGTSVMAWEVIAAIAMVFMAVVFLPRYLQRGIATVPQYLAQRFGPSMQVFLAIWFILLSTLTFLPFVLATGAIALAGLFNVGTMLGLSDSAAIWMLIWLIGIIGGLYSVLGGLKAVAVSDTINGIGLLLGGLLIPVLGLIALGKGSLAAGIEHLLSVSPQRLSPLAQMQEKPFVPFSTLFTGMLWVNVNYWCMNQSIIQRTFGARSLAEGQKGVLLAGGLKLVGTLILVLPGIVAFALLGPDLPRPDMAYPQLVQKVLPAWCVGFFGAVVFGAILSSYNSALHSISTMFSMDIYRRIIRRRAGDRELVRVGQGFGILLVGLSCTLAPWIVDMPGGIFAFMKEITAYVAAPLSTIVVAGIFLPRVSARAAYVAFPLSVAFQFYFGYVAQGNLLGWQVHWLHLVALNVSLTLTLMLLLSWGWPNRRVAPEHVPAPVDMTWWKGTLPASVLIILLVVAMYAGLAWIGRG